MLQRVMQKEAFNQTMEKNNIMSEKPVECEATKAAHCYSGACSSSLNPPSSTSNDDSSSVYGELVVLGYNGSDIRSVCEKRKSKFVLCCRPEASGIKKSKCYSVKDPNFTTTMGDNQKFCVRYDFSNTESYVTEYIHDDSTDMFQIGRSTEPCIDFVVFDTIPGYKRKRNVKPPKATISRYACRIVIDRSSVNRKVRIFCGAFNSSRNIFIGEKAATWMYNNEPDGATTNGILIMHPEGLFFSGRPAHLWYEVSVKGDVFPKRMLQFESPIPSNVSNRLIDGSLIYFGGAVLLWRTTEGLKNTPNKIYLAMMNERVTGTKIPSSPSSSGAMAQSSTGSDNKQSFVYIDCGHVEHLPENDVNSMIRQCSKCNNHGMMIKLKMGFEPNIYIDHGPAICALNPCGHLCSERTMKYWIKVPIPKGMTEFLALCPFCATPIEGDPGFVILKPSA